jgi:hypothetical protein
MPRFFGPICSNKNCNFHIPAIGVRTDDEAPPNPIDPASKGFMELPCPKCKKVATYPVTSFQLIPKPK